MSEVHIFSSATFLKHFQSKIKDYQGQ